MSVVYDVANNVYDESGLELIRTINQTLSHFASLLFVPRALPSHVFRITIK